jgi:Arc/MetJ family transcription regulator
VVAVEKVSLSLDAELVAKARKVAGHRGLSALVNDALRIKLQHERLRSLLVTMDVELGPVPADELARARKRWPAAGITTPKPRRSA